MTAVKASFTGDYRYRTTSLKVLKEIDMDHESNSSSSEDSEYYSPKSVFVKKLPMTMKEVSVSRARVHNPILRIRAEDRQIGEDIGEGLISKFTGNDRVDFVMFSRPTSPLGGKTSSIGTEH
ncbi:hypothetical protein R6Q59_020119 [Mikania micrantha]